MNFGPDFKSQNINVLSHEQVRENAAATKTPVATQVEDPTPEPEDIAPATFEPEAAVVAEQVAADPPSEAAAEPLPEVVAEPSTEAPAAPESSEDKSEGNMAILNKSKKAEICCQPQLLQITIPS